MARAVAIVASSRKGSWMTLSALQGHPSVFVHREQWFSHPEFMKLEPRTAVRQLYDARTKVDAIVHSHYPMPYPYYLDNKAFYQYLCATSDAVFVFLHRRNMIRWYVSILLAQREQKWSCLEPPVGVVPQVDVDCTAFLQNVAADVRAYESARKEIAGSDCQIRDIEYEDMAAQPFDTLQRLQRSLCLFPVPLKPTTFKQHDQPLRTLISNYDQFAEDLRMSGSPLADFLE
jgi:hypothetical protein